ncbi:hypothetical protein [Roseibium sp. M-1]
MGSQSRNEDRSENSGSFHQREEILGELQRVLDSETFCATPKRREMLRYLVEETLAGRSETLKGYAIGLAVFNRDETFNPQSDPIVRLEARRLRHDLDSYYISEGAGNLLRISIPKGQYAPRFHNQSKASFEEAHRDHQQLAQAPDEVQPAPAGDQPEPPAVTGRRMPLYLAIAASLVALLALGAGYATGNFWKVPSKSDTSRPSVMVLPFTVASEDADQELLAAGIADQIMTVLSRFPDFRIFLPAVARTSFEPLDPAELLGAHGAAFLISGSVVSEGELIRVGARLVHAPSGRVLWSGSYDRARNRSTLLEIERSIAADIGTIVGQPYGLIKTELTSSLAADFDPSADSFECVLRGYVYRRKFSAELHPVLRACLERAVIADPGYSEAWAMLGWIYLDAARFGFAKKGEKELFFDRGLDAASHALTLDANSVLALKAMSSINHYMGSIAEGERFARKAVEINPYDPDSLAQLGWRLAVVGNFEEGIPILQSAIDRTTNAPGWYFHLIAIDHLLNRRFAEMLTAAKTGAIDGSGVSWCLVAIAQSELGNGAAARAALDKMAEISPGLNRDPSAFLRVHQADGRIVDAMLNGLRDAGWAPPEGG